MAGHRIILPIPDIIQDMENWTVRIMVKHRYGIRDSHNSSVKFQKLLLVDKDGNEVQATMYNPDPKLSKKLESYNTCSISNAKVLPSEEKFRIVDNVYCWVIDRKTVVTLITVDHFPRELGAPDYISFGDILQYMNTPTYIDVIGVVIDVLTSRMTSGKCG